MGLKIKRGSEDKVSKNRYCDLRMMWRKDKEYRGQGGLGFVWLLRPYQPLSPK